MKQKIKASTFDKPFTKKDWYLMALAHKALEGLSNRHGNEEIAGVFISLALNLKKGLRKGLVKNTLDYYEKTRDAGIRAMK